MNLLNQAVGSLSHVKLVMYASIYVVVTAIFHSLVIAGEDQPYHNLSVVLFHASVDVLIPEVQQTHLSNTYTISAHADELPTLQKGRQKEKKSKNFLSSQSAHAQRFP